MQKFLIYESLSDYIKPKSEEEIRNALRNERSPSLRIIKGIKYNNKTIVKETLDLLGPNPKLNFTWGYFIETAILHKNYEILKLMLSYKHIRDNLTPAHIKKCEKILNQNLKESLTDYIKPKSKEEIQKILSKLKLKPNKKLYLGVQHNMPELVQEALDEGANPNYNNVISIAAELNNYEIIKILLNQLKIDPRGNNDSAFIHVCNNNNIEIAKLLLSHPSMESDFYNILIDIAVDAESYEITEYILKNKEINPKLDQNYTIWLAYSNRSIEIMKLLLSDKRIKNSLSTKELNLYLNYLEYNKDELDESLSDYVKPKTKEEIRKSLGKLTPNKKLMQACWHGIDWLAKEALEQGADPNFDKRTPMLHVTIARKYINIVKMLLQNERTNIEIALDLIEQILRYPNERNKELIEFFLNNERIKNSFSKDLYNYYLNKYLKYKIINKI